MLPRRAWLNSMTTLPKPPRNCVRKKFFIYILTVFKTNSLPIRVWEEI